MLWVKTNDVDSRSGRPGCRVGPRNAGTRAGRSRRVRAHAHAHPGHRRGDVGIRADVGVQPGPGRRCRAVLLGDDRDLDRNGLAGRLVRLDRHREPAVVVRRRGVSARRGFRGGVHRARQPRHDGRPVLPERPGERRRRRLPVERIVELRLGNRPLGIRRRGLLPDGRRRDALDQRRRPRHAGGRGAAGGDLVQRRLVCAGAQGNRLL